MNLVNELQVSAENDDVLTVLRKTMRLASKLNRCLSAVSPDDRAMNALATTVDSSGDETTAPRKSDIVRERILSSMVITTGCRATLRTRSTRTADAA